MMQEDQKGCKKNNIRAEEEQITAARAKQHEDEKEDTCVRPVTMETRCFHKKVGISKIPAKRFLYRSL